jgi:hypothetical protein
MSDNNNSDLPKDFHNDYDKAVEQVHQEGRTISQHDLSDLEFNRRYNNNPSTQ